MIRGAEAAAVAAACSGLALRSAATSGVARPPRGCADAAAPVPLAFFLRWHELFARRSGCSTSGCASV